MPSVGLWSVGTSLARPRARGGRPLAVSPDHVLPARCVRASWPGPVLSSGEHAGARRPTRRGAGPGSGDVSAGPLRADLQRGCVVSWPFARHLGMPRPSSADPGPPPRTQMCACRSLWRDRATARRPDPAAPADPAASAAIAVVCCCSLSAGPCCPLSVAVRCWLRRRLSAAFYCRAIRCLRPSVVSHAVRCPSLGAAATGGVNPWRGRFGLDSVRAPASVCRQPTAPRTAFLSRLI